MKVRANWAAPIVVAALVPVLLGGCNGHASVQVNCAPPQTVETRLGILNTPGLQLGSLFVVNTATLQGRSLGTLAPVLNEMSRTPREDDLRLPVEDGLAISVETPGESPGEVERGLRAYVERASEFRLRGRQSRSIFNVDYYFEERGHLVRQIAELPPPTAGKDVVFLVTTETTAESVSLGLADTVSPADGPITVSFGGHTLGVEYRGLPSELAAGHGGAAFVRATPVRYLPDDEKIVIDVTQELDLARCNLSQAGSPR